MKKIIRLTETDLTRIVKRVILEQSGNVPYCDRYKDKPETYKKCLGPTQVEFDDVFDTYNFLIQGKGDRENKSISFKTIGDEIIRLKFLEVLVSDNITAIVHPAGPGSLGTNEILKPTFSFIYKHFKLGVDGSTLSSLNKLSNKFPENFRKINKPYGYSVNLASIPNVKIPSDVITKFLFVNTWVFYKGNDKDNLTTLFSKNTPPNIHPDFIKKFSSRV
jgi:hypothetical protein